MKPDLSCQFESLADEFTRQLRDGNPPDIEKVAAEHPELAGRIRELFPVLQMMEARGAKSVSDDDALMREELKSLSGLPPQRKLGEYRIIREIGRGGMGVVYQAEQESLGRHVALKLLPDSAQFDDRRRQRFQHEARASGMLHHTNIVPVFGIGHSEDVSYFVMQYIEGNSLDKVIDELRSIKSLSLNPVRDKSLHETGVSHDTIVSGVVQHLLNESEQTGDKNPDAEPAPVPPDSSSKSSSGSTSRLALSASSNTFSRGSKYFRNVAKIGLQVSDALAYAHSKQILHRDIKPANLLVEENGNVWVTDFGLAKLMNEANLTRTGETVGTLRYLPPEQFDGKSDQRSDVYSLGLTLYELLTLQPAFDGEDFAQLVQNVTDSDPVSLRKLEPKIPRDLATIVNKAIAKSPADRYQSAAAMHQDLELFLDGKPIHAQRTSEFDRFVKAVKRRPIVSALVATLLATMIVGSALVTWKWREATASLVVAQKESTKREKINDFLLNDFLGLANPDNEPDADIRLRTVLDRASEKIDARFNELPIVAADLHIQFGQIYLRLSQPAKSNEHFEQAFQLRSTELGPDDPTTQDALYRVGIAAADMGQFERALAILDESLEYYQAYYGSESPETYQVRFSRAEVLRELARFEEARTEIEAYLLVADREEILDADAARQRLAEILFSQGQLDESKEMLMKLQSELEERVEVVDRQVRGGEYMMNDFYKLLGTKENLGLIAIEQGFPDLAAEIHQENLTMATELLGPEHSTTLSHAHNFAGALMELERADEALELLRKTALLSERTRGTVHPATLVVKNALAMSMILTGDSEGAEELLLETRQQAIESLGIDHPDTITCSYNLSSTWYRTGQTEKAERLLSETVPVCRVVLGEHHTQTINAIADLGHIHRQLKKYDLAEAELAEAVGLSRGHMRVFHPELLQNITNLQMLLVETKQYEKAEPLGEELIEGYTLEFGPKHWKSITAKNIQAFVLKQQEKFEQAHHLYLDVWQHHCDESGPAGQKSVSILLILADVEHELGLHSDSIPRLEEYCELSIDENPPTWSRNRALRLLGRALMETGDLASAEAILLDAFEFMKSHYGNVSGPVRQTGLQKTANCLMELYKRSGEEEKQKMWKEKYRELQAVDAG